MSCPYSRIVGYVIVQATVGFERCFKPINPSNYYIHHQFTTKKTLNFSIHFVFHIILTKNTISLHTIRLRYELILCT